MNRPVLLCHGGAGSKKPLKAALSGLEKTLAKSFKLLDDGGSALDAVTSAIVHMENSGLYNAGKGANLQLDGIRRLDASIMEGNSLQAGAVIGLEGFANPILLSRLVMDMAHKVFTNLGAAKIAEAEKIARLGPPNERSLKRLDRAMAKGGPALELYRKYFSTVGAIALDSSGCLAAGSSTGGVFAMLPGRVGDTPLIGSGVYADNSLGAVACTGRGEDILRLCLAKEVCMNMKNRSAEDASYLSFKRALSLGFQAGILALDRKGRWSITHTTAHMPAGAASKEGVIVRDRFRRVE
ncbi:MAG: isoaspartyl peptidase/L-asparaginase [Deltaproteobacteria bacterium]|nr:isoaspartyl peptidase/L-asparaginase [Deltaproteobacteria bacterium]